ncbi:MAG: hypothetical protein J6S97_00940 [Bacteroidales bacterium]|nr:hypothetical protein [Bacteroidales bacterium]
MRRTVILFSILLLSVLSCTKDIPPATGMDERQSAQYDAASVLFSELLCRSVTPEELIELKGKKIEPEIGRVTDDSKPFERTVRLEEDETADFYFGGLVGWEEEVLTETAGGYIIDFTPIGLGRLEFFRVPDGSNVGYATVDIPCMPHLERINYKTPSQMGVNDAEYPSPARYGDLFWHSGRYYLCVRAATGYLIDESGMLVCIEAGKGSNWVNYLNKEDWGCWKPRQDWYDISFLSRYLTLCSDTKFKQDKAQIVKKYPGKVFPLLQRWHNYDSQENIGDLTWGFGTLEPGYYHVTHINDDIAKEKNAGLKVVIARDATEGDYKASAARWYRRFHFYTLPSVCTSKSQLSAQTYKYTGKGGWEDFFEDDYNSPIVYTMNAVRFYETLPDGYQLLNIWDEYDDDYQDADGFIRVKNESELATLIDVNSSVKLRLTADITLSSNLIVHAPKTVTIDLNGHTLGRKLAAADGAGNVIYVVGANLTVLNGTLSGGWDSYGGGGVDVDKGSRFQATKVSFSGNKAGERGGGIWNRGTTTLTDCIIEDNYCPYGGGIFNNWDGGTLIMSGCTVRGNSCGSGGGGGVCNYSTATIESCTITGNSGNSAGGLWNGPYQTYTCTLNMIGGNVVSDNTGGNLLLNGGSVIKVAGAFTSGTEIYVKRIEGEGVITSGYSTYNPSLNPADIFFADDSDYYVTLSGSEAVLKKDSL